MDNMFLLIIGNSRLYTVLTLLIIGLILQITQKGFKMIARRFTLRFGTKSQNLLIALAIIDVGMFSIKQNSMLTIFESLVSLLYLITLIKINSDHIKGRYPNQRV
jgi:hypothetical protein